MNVERRKFLVDLGLAAGFTLVGCLFQRRAAARRTNEEGFRVHPGEVSYGADPAQAGDLYLPNSGRAPIVVLLHGGFWRMPYGREQFDAAARALVERGYAVWNLGYRRIGAPNVGWSEISSDVLAGIDSLAEFKTEIDLDRVVLVGHSAGGQLALWAAATRRRGSGVRVRAAVALAPISDLVDGWRLGLGKGAVEAMLGAAPDDAPDQYAQASPLALLPLGVAQHILHGDADSAVPVAMSRRYLAAAKAAGDNAELHEIADAGHMEFLDPGSNVFELLYRTLVRVAQPGG